MRVTPSPSGLLDGLRRADLIGGARRKALTAIDESSLVSILDEASLVAAITCSRPGANPPTKAEVEAAQRDGARPQAAGPPAPAPGESGAAAPSGPSPTPNRT